MRRVLGSPRWIAFTVLAIAMVALCIRLGFWQLDRLEGRRVYNERFRTGMAAAPEPLDALLRPGAGSPAYRRAVAEGRYDPEREVILYGRALDGRPGNHVLTPLVLDDGRAIVVDRGWVPSELDDPPVHAVAPPEGTVRVTGFLSPAETGGADDGDVDDRATTFTRVDLDAIGRQVPYEILPWFVALQEQTPPQSGDLPAVVPPPSLDEGPHLSYAFQWFAFAAVGVVGYVILARRQVREPGKDPATMGTTE